MKWRFMSMLRVGIAGFGFMGRTHYKCWKKVEGAEVVAVCDVNPNIEEDTKRAVGNIGDAQEAIDFSSLQLYTDFEKMLTEAKLDAVSIRMIAEARRSGKVLQIGHCVRFWPEYAKAKELIDSGKYGRVIAAMFQRLGSAPTWSIDNWFLDEERSGGMALDLHIHDTDFVQYLFGVPSAVCSFGAKVPGGGGLVHIVTQYLYDDDKVVTAEGGWAMTPTFGFEMSFNIVLEKATLVYDLTREPMFKVCPAEGEAFTPEVEEGDGWFLQIAHFAKAISGKKVKAITTLEESMNSVKIVKAEKESVNKGQKVSIG
jgi:predicted dehydrogenase